ncbi:MAG: TIGR04282 family arsenosugar biosynthesis glycosyltransferase [Hyphomicrobiales bacterium]
MQRHVILFARPPRYGCVKTRLARDIGKGETLRFYRNNLSRVLGRLKAMQSIKLTVALTPDNVVFEGAGPHFCDVPIIPQGHGDLGAKMARALNQPEVGPTIVIGSDIPDISPHYIEEAFKALHNNDAVFGPCDDGGYWLIGLKKLAPTPSGFLKNIEWSTSQALQQSVATLPKQWKVGYISTLDDIDTGADLAAWKKTNTGR